MKQMKNLNQIRGGVVAAQLKTVAAWAIFNLGTKAVKAIKDKV